MLKKPRQLTFLKSVFSIQVIKEQLKVISSDTLVSRGVKLLLLLDLLLVGGVAVLSERVPPQIPLHYARPWGELQLVGRASLWWLGGGVIMVGLVNILLSAFLFEKFRLLSRIVIWSSLLLGGLSLLSLGTVWFRVGG